jgi:hypothetical protein
MSDNFNLKQFLLENKLAAPIKMHESSERVQEVYDDLIETISEIAKTLSDDEAYELHEKLKKFFNGGIVNELERDDRTGLYVTGRTIEDNTRIGKMAEETGLHGEWNAREGYWFFQEDEEMYDALEKVIQDGLDEYQINARIEGIF